MQNSKNSMRIKRLTAVAMFCALAYVCMLVIKIPVAFLTLDVKDSLIILCSLLFGPVSGLIVAVVVPLLEFITISETAVYGLIMNMLSSVTFCTVTGLIYRAKKSLFGAIAGLCAGVCATTAIMVLANLFITPHFLGSTTEEVAALIPKMLLPFNLVKATLNAAIVLLLYKPLSITLKKIGFVRPSASKKSADGEAVAIHHTRSVLITVIAVAVIAASLAIVFFVLR